MLLSYPSDIALESRSSQPKRSTPPVQREADSSRAAEFAICDQTIEAGFRSDKTTGWQWEACRITALTRIERLLVAMAWATLLVICLGLQEARSRLQAVAQPAPAPSRATRPTRPPAIPQPSRHSLFTLGLSLARRWLARTAVPIVRWRLTHLSSLSWNARWLQAQAYQFVFPRTVRL